MSNPGYKYLKSYQVSVVIYDLTVQFCDRWIDRRSRTHDQTCPPSLCSGICRRVVQSARSGKQIDALEEKFITEGGYSENLFKKRPQERGKK